MQANPKTHDERSVATGNLSGNKGNPVEGLGFLCVKGKSHDGLTLTPRSWFEVWLAADRTLSCGSADRHQASVVPPENLLLSRLPFCRSRTEIPNRPVCTGGGLVRHPMQSGA